MKKNPDYRPPPPLGEIKTMPDLNVDHIKDVLNREIEIGFWSDKGSQFTYNPWARLYTFRIDGSVYHSSHLYDVVLEEYNAYNRGSHSVERPWTGWNKPSGEDL